MNTNVAQLNAGSGQQYQEYQQAEQNSIQQHSTPMDSHLGSQNEYYQQGEQQMKQRLGDGNQMNCQSNQVQGQQRNEQIPSQQTSTNQTGAYNQGESRPQHGGGQQFGVGEPAQAAEQDSVHKFLDRIEKKFGGERFNNPDNLEKNRKLNDSLIAKATQVLKIVMQRGPAMITKMVH